MAFGSNNSFSTGTGAKGKNLNPGKHKCRVTHISINEVKWPKDNAPRLMMSLHLETEKPSDDFVGFMIDQKDPSKGNYAGQVGYVKSSSWGYQDNKLKDKAGKFIAKEMLAAQFLHWLCINANGSNWVNDNLGKHASFEEFIKAFNKDMPMKDDYLNYVVGGTKEMKDNGYYKYTNLSLPLVDKADKALGMRNYTNDKNVGNLVEFNPTVHVYDKTGGAAEVSNFDGKKETSVPIDEAIPAPVFKESADNDIDFTPPTSEEDVFNVEEGTAEENIDDIFDVK